MLGAHPFIRMGAFLVSPLIVVATTLQHKTASSSLHPEPAEYAPSYARISVCNMEIKMHKYLYIMN